MKALEEQRVARNVSLINRKMNERERREFSLRYFKGMQMLLLIKNCLEFSEISMPGFLTY